MKTHTPFWRQRETWLALTITTIFSAGVMLLPSATWPPVSESRAAPFVPHLVFQPDSTSRVGVATWDSDPRALASPVLFALPTAVGFSPSVGGAVFAPPPLLRDRAGSALWLDRMPIEEPARAVLGERTGPEVERVLSSRWTHLPLLNDPFAQPLSTGAVMQVEWPDGAPPLVGTDPLLLDLPASQDEKPWDAVAYIYFSSAGEARSVFIEQSTASGERNDAIARSLRKLRIERGHEQGVRVKLFLQRPQTLFAREAEAMP